MKLQKSDKTISVAIQKNTHIIPMRERGAVSIPVYHGVYEVTPNANAEVELATAGMKLENNVVVETIPYLEISNPNGTTVIIGE